MATDVITTYPHSQRTTPSLLDRLIPLSRDKIEVAAYIVIVTLSIIAHLWGLGKMALHHDESIHAYMSWRFYTGEGGGFNCARDFTSPTYCYDPVYHGPSLYVLTLLSYFLFGDGDAQARLPMAVAGVLLVASCWFLRPYLGKRGALIAAVLLGFSPSLLYYTRFARHDGLMVLWELWMVIGFFRYLDSGRAGFLYLLAVGTALAVATHELYYILFFIFGLFVLLRLLSEAPIYPHLKHAIIVLLLAVCGVFIAINPPLPFGQGLYLGDKTFMIGVALLLGWLAMLVWESEPVLLRRLSSMWRDSKLSILIAFGLLFGIYLVLYTTFFTYPRGAIHGLYTGLEYWLLTQQDFKRGDQPWYYYFMQLPLYEPLGVVCGIGAMIYLCVEAFRRLVQPATRTTDAASLIGSPYLVAEAPTHQEPPNTADRIQGSGDGKQGRRSKKHKQHPTHGDGQRKHTPDEPDEPNEPDGHAESAPHVITPEQRQSQVIISGDSTATAAAQRPAIFSHLFAVFLVFWYFNAIIIFSWAGEKMPWLVVHMALPGNLIAAWALGRLLRAQDTSPDRVMDQPGPSSTATPDPTQEQSAEERSTQRDVRTLTVQRFLVPICVLVLLLSASVAFWRLSTPAENQAGQSHLLQGIVPLMFVFFTIYALLTIAHQVGVRVVLALVGVTLSVILGAYMVRSTWLVVYHHPDTPIEPLVYVQTAPDVPRYMEDVRELAINLSRDHRTVDDVAGELSMPIIVDIGSNGGGLTWPVQWYLRDFQNIVWRSGEQFRAPTTDTFQTTLPNGEEGLAPIVMIHRADHITEDTYNALREGYVPAYGDAGVFNWWFPEGKKCSPQEQGYKRFYLHSWMSHETLIEQCGAPFVDAIESGDKQLYPPWAPLLWPFQRENRDNLVAYVLYRDLPDPLSPEASPLQLGSRDMEVWIRRDLAGGSGDGDTISGQLRLKAHLAIGAGTLTNPTDVAVGRDGTIYIADTNAHHVAVFDADGNLIDTIGTFGNGENQFYEPRGVALDDQGNIYVADTWNARIVKLDNDGTWLTSWGTGAEPLMEGDDRMVTNTEGTREGNAANPLGFFGPRGVAVDSDGYVYVADTGNKRIVVTDDEGDFVYQWGYEGAALGAFDEPAGVAVDQEGHVYVADVWNGRVQVFPPIPTGAEAADDAQFVPITTWNVPGWQANSYDDLSIAVGPERQVYSTIPQRQLAFAANRQGDIGVTWGGPGDTLASLNLPSGVAVGPEGDVYVIDRELGQVLRFTVPEVLYESDSDPE